MPGFSLSILLRALAVWLVIMAAESAQGALRQWLAGPQGAFVARQVAVFTGALVIFAIAWIFRRWMRLRSNAGALGVGALWVALTVAFEVGLGRVLGYGWDRMLEDYDLRHGGLMPLGLVAMALTPWLVRRLNPVAEGALP